MKHFHIKSLVLGIGMGIILTSLVGFIYTAGTETGANGASNSQAAENTPGMFENTGKTTQGEPDPTQASNGESGGRTAEGQEEGAQGSDGLNEDAVVLDIERGDTSQKVAEKLLSLGLIKDAGTFNDKLLESRVDTRLAVGSFKLERGMDEQDIMKAIVNP